MPRPQPGFRQYSRHDATPRYTAAGYLEFWPRKNGGRDGNKPSTSRTVETTPIMDHFVPQDLKPIIPDSTKTNDSANFRDPFVWKKGQPIANPTKPIDNKIKTEEEETKPKQGRSKKYPPWFSDELCKLIKRKEHVWRLIKKKDDKEKEYRQSFSELRKQVKATLKVDKDALIERLNESAKKDPNNILELAKAESEFPVETLQFKTKSSIANY